MSLVHNHPAAPGQHDGGQPIAFTCGACGSFEKVRLKRVSVECHDFVSLD